MDTGEGQGSVADVVWCVTCCTRHVDAACPGEIRVTGTEAPVWKAVYRAAHGHEAYGVLVAPAGESWRARIFTYPNALWTIPGGKGAMKFVGPTAPDARRQAVEFVEEHCRRLGNLPENGIKAGAGSAAASPRPSPSPRKTLQVPAHWGLDKPTERGETDNLSAEGLFVVTSSPPEPGTRVHLRIDLQACRLPLRGRVIWTRSQVEPSLPPGMGIQLMRPPAMYVGYVQTLP